MLPEDFCRTIESAMRMHKFMFHGFAIMINFVASTVQEHSFGLSLPNDRADIPDTVNILIQHKQTLNLAW